jgi:hypothetical protein
MKQELDNYYKKCAERNSIIKKEADLAWREIQKEAQKLSDENEEEALKENESPCSVCKKSEFVLKYRDIQGKIKGETHGYFSLFGGSIYGYVDGDISTKPILSCRNCENERQIVVPKYIDGYELLEQQMPSAFPTIGSYYKSSDWLKKKGIEVARELGKHLFLPEEYHDIREMNDAILQKCGMELKYPKIKKPSFMWLKQILISIF